MTRRKPVSFVLLLALALAALGPLAVAGRARAQDATPAVDESLSGTVTYWTGYNADPEFTTLTKEVIPAFNKLYPNVKIDAQAIPYDDLRQKLLTGIAGGQTPDILRSDIIWVPEF